MTILTEDGYVNPAHVWKVTCGGKNKHGAPLSILHLINGETSRAIGEVEDVVVNLDPVIQALHGFDLLTSWKEENGSFIELDREPILAWRMGRYDPAPVTASRAEILDNPQGIQFPDGSVLDIEWGERYKDAEAWLASLNKRAKHERELKAAS